MVHAARQDGLVALAKVSLDLPWLRDEIFENVDSFLSGQGAIA